MISIKVSDATKQIKKRMVLDSVSFEINEPGIYGFLGINGSGKSMLFRALAGLIHLDSGTIEINGKQIGHDSLFPESLGLVISAAFWDEYTGFENLQLIASIKKLIRDEDIKKALIRVGLDPNDKRLYKQYSLGMKQRLEIAQAIMEQPNLYILDEPSNGLDKHGLKLLKTIIKEEAQRGATILIAAHNTPELTAMCRKQFEMYEGKLVNVTSRDGNVS